MNGGTLGLEAMAHTMGYENRLFDNTKVHTIDIVMDDWDEFIDNATSEEYYDVAMVIDGEAYKNVAIRGKGGNSGGMPDRDRNKGNFGGRGLSDNTTSTKPNADESTSADMNIQGTSASAAESMPQNSGMPAMPEGFDPSQMQGGFGGMFPGGASDETGTAPSDNSDNTDSTNNSNRPSRDNMQMPGGNFDPNMDNMGNATSSSTNWVWIAVSFAVLGVGLLIAKLYKH